jgi:hypothetical protein
MEEIHDPYFRTGNRSYDWYHLGAAVFAQTAIDDSVLTRSRYLPQDTASGELVLPANSIWREWVLVGVPLTPNALNGGHANFPEYHNVYIEPGSYAIYKTERSFSRNCS